MTKQTRESINLGNDTYARGFNDGLNGRPVTIKKSHAHAHRYYKGHAAGGLERSTTMRSALAIEEEGVMQSFIKHSELIKRLETEEKPKGFLSRLFTWFRK